MISRRSFIIPVMGSKVMKGYDSIYEWGFVVRIRSEDSYMNGRADFNPQVVLA
jgi:hypothetical protein